MFAAELHAHSEASYDGRDPVEALLERARAVGLDALAVTDHDELAASRRAADLAPEYGLVGITGMEVSSADGHVLALGVDRSIPPDRPFLRTVERVHEAGGIAVVPHPFQEMRNGVLANVPRETLTRADAIEVYNSRLITGRSNRQAERFARRNGMPMTAGSDAHVADMVGRAVTRIDADERAAESILDGVRRGRTVLDTRRTPWRVSFRQAVGNTRRRLELFLTGLVER